MISIVAEGRLAATPHIELVGNNSSLVKFRLLSNRYSQGQEHLEVVNFFCFGEMAERFASLAIKGQIISAMGVQETSRWKDRETQEQREAVRYRMTHFELGPKPKSATAGQSSEQPQRRQPNQETASRPSQGTPPADHADPEFLNSVSEDHSYHSSTGTESKFGLI